MVFVVVLHCHGQYVGVVAASITHGWLAVVDLDDDVFGIEREESIHQLNSHSHIGSHRLAIAFMRDTA